jgi:hypothetical protein
VLQTPGAVNTSVRNRLVQDALNVRTLPRLKTSDSGFKNCHILALLLPFEIQLSFIQDGKIITNINR